MSHLPYRRQSSLGLVLLCVCASTLGYAPGFAATKPAGVDPKVWIVTSGGFWQHASRYGTMRVVVRNEGWEHAKSFITVEWLAHDDSVQVRSVVESRVVLELDDQGWVNVDAV